jgi:hypothetical protein
MLVQESQQSRSSSLREALPKWDFPNPPVEPWLRCTYSEDPATRLRRGLCEDHGGESRERAVAICGNCRFPRFENLTWEICNWSCAYFGSFLQKYVQARL